MFEGYGESGDVCGIWGRVGMFEGIGGEWGCLRELGESGDV